MPGEMRSGYWKLALVAGVMMVSGCVRHGDGFAPGEWQLESWMEAEGHDQRISPETLTVKLRPEVAAMDPRAVMFSEFYRGQKPTNVTFDDGKISGHLDQQAVAPFPAHEQPISGWYRPDAFELRITLPSIAGVQGYQVVTGRLKRAAD